MAGREILVKEVFVLFDENKTFPNFAYFASFIGVGVAVKPCQELAALTRKTKVLWEISRFTLFLSGC